MRFLSGFTLCAFVVLAAGCYVSIGTDGDIAIGGIDITQQPRDQTVTAGSSARFTVGVAGTGPLRFQWRRNGADISGATSFSYTTPPTSAADDGTLFSVRVCNDIACVTSSSALLTVL